MEQKLLFEEGFEKIIPRKAILSIVEVGFDLIGKSWFKKQGPNYKGLCVFHLEKSPSFYLYTNSNQYFCYGCGSQGGPVSMIINIPNNIEYRLRRRDDLGLGYLGKMNYFRLFSGPADYIQSKLGLDLRKEEDLKKFREELYLNSRDYLGYQIRNQEECERILRELI